MNVWLLGLAASFATSVAKEDSLPAFVMQPVEIRAPLLPDPTGPFPLTTRRLGRETIARRPGADLHAVLTPVAGVRVTSAGSPEVSSSLSIRGSTPDQVLVLVDGRRQNVAQGGGVDLATIPLESVESVEIFRGGASALWGSDAVGGAISVRTRKPRAGDRRLRVGAGSHGERTITGGAAVALGGDWTARGSGRLYATDGDWEWTDDRRGTTSTMENADLRRLSGDFRVDGRAAGFDLRADVTGMGSERGVPGSEEFPTPTARLEDRRSSAGLRARRARGVWHVTADADWTRLHRQYTDPAGAFGPVHDRHENDRASVDLAATRVGRDSSLRLATGASHDRLDSSTDGQRERAAFDVRGQFAHDHVWAGRSVRWMVAARADAVQDFDPYVSPRVGILGDVFPDLLALRASVGLSYRTPSFDELFWPARATAAGNPDLRAERGRDLDLGITLRGFPGAGRLEIDAFVRRVDDLIQWTPGAAGIWRPHNVGRATIAGVEAEGGFEIPLPLAFRGEVTGAVTRLESRDETGEPNVDGKELPYRPRWTGAAGIVARRGHAELETAWRWVDDVWVTRANTKTLSGYVMGDVRGRVGVARGFSLDAAIRNIANVSARDFRDYPLPGRTFQVGFTAEAGR
jgi:outer membrane cobalamin receptor